MAMLFYGKSKTVSKEVPGVLDLSIGPFEILSETFSSKHLNNGQIRPDIN